MFKKKNEVTGYVGKSGKNAAYKIISKFVTKEGVVRVKLESFGAIPLTFWADKDKLCEAPPPKFNPNAHTKVCWECGHHFTYAQCQHNEGDWSESYFGC
ncbi:MAG: hypothetical protein ACRC1D_09455 [Culicoidibacterales bacterium]